MSDDKKDLPSVEYSLKSISWHMKCLVEETKKFREEVIKTIESLNQIPPF